MPDNKRKKKADSTRISITERWERDYWTKALKCTLTQLRAAVKSVGPSARKVRAWLSVTHEIRVVLMQRSVFGSLFQQGKYGGDTLLEIRDWIDKMLAAVPEQYRSEVSLDLDSEGGWEGEHHVEMEVYYNRPENDQEREKREGRETAQRAENEQAERGQLAALMRKYG